MRLVMPALFIRLPARMKNGTASSGKLSMPLTIRWITTKPGRVPAHQMYSSEDPAMAIATGRPLLMSSRKMILSMLVLVVGASGCARHAIVHGGLRPFQDRIAAPAMGQEHLHRAE